MTVDDLLQLVVPLVALFCIVDLLHGHVGPLCDWFRRLGRRLRA